MAAKWEYALDVYTYDDGGLKAMFSDRAHLDRRRDDGWWIRETFRGLKGIEVLWEREVKETDNSSPASEDSDS